MSFVNPWFLLGLLAAGVPVLLHLIRRERARDIEFPTLMFLRRISRKTVRFQKLRHLLLLLLRVAALALLAMAFTRPYRPLPPSVAGDARLATTHVILLDNSMSMAYERRWERAKAAAADVARAAADGDRVALVAFNDRSTILVPPALDSGLVLGALGSVVVSDRPTRFGQALRTGERVALDAGAGKRVLHLISDFQKNGAVSEDQLFRAGAGIEIRPVDVGGDDYSNLAFGEVELTEEDAESGQGPRVKSSLVNFGSEERPGVPVNLLLDGRNVDERKLDLRKGEVKPVEFRLPRMSTGPHSLELRVEDVRLSKDNAFFLTIESRGRIPVISVEDEAPRRNRSPGFFLGNALNIPSLSPYRFSTIPAQRLDRAEIPPGAVLVWNDASGGSAAAGRRLESLVKAGTGLVVAVGDSLSPDSFNRVFSGWLPFRVVAGEGGRPGGRTGSVGYALMTDVRLDHPLFRPFSAPHSGSFSSAKFFRHAKLQPGDGADILARFDNGEPAVLAATAGRGRVLVMAFSADDSGNDLPLKAVYVPFWHQALDTVRSERNDRHWYEVGQTVAPRGLLTSVAGLRGVSPPAANDNLALLDPEKSRVEISRDTDTAEVEHAGLYDLRSAGMSMALAVNTVPRESDLGHGNAEEMAASWSSGGAGPAAVSPDERPTAEDLDRRQGIWRYLLLAAALAFAGELLLSNRLSTKSV